jgi:alpha-tubulin suppressor-like RCC1 family protein
VPTKSDRVAFVVPLLLLGFSVYACGRDSEPTASDGGAGDGGAGLAAAGVGGAETTGENSAGGVSQSGNSSHPAGGDGRGGDGRGGDGRGGDGRGGGGRASQGGDGGDTAQGEGGAPSGGAAGSGGQGDDPRAIAIATGNFHTCALLSDGSARCWGLNYFGQLGSGTFTGPEMCINNATMLACSATPVMVDGLLDATALALGGYLSCALLPDGTVKCWGLNDNGQLGNDSSTGPSLCLDGIPCATTPVAVSDLRTATAISASEEEHSCALLADGSVQCWGLNDTGQNGMLGPSVCGPHDFPCAMKPVTVPGLSDVIGVSTATFHTCAVLSTGKVRCWGNNLSGQLGSGTTDDSLAPIEVAGISDATAIACGNTRSCALVGGGSIKCWGSNRFGELGNGVPGNATCAPGTSYSFACSTSPVAVSLIDSATALALGANHACALLDDASVWCWGHGENTPTQVPGLGPVTAISAAADHTCALLDDGSVWCWGDNLFGWLGDGTTTSSAAPVRVNW